VDNPERMEVLLSALERRQKQLEFSQRAHWTFTSPRSKTVSSFVFCAMLADLSSRRPDPNRKLADAAPRLRGILAWLSPPGPDPYQVWMEHEVETELPLLTASPCFSILLPLVKPRLEWLKRTIASVRAQSYPNWELCIFSAASSEPSVREFSDHGRHDPSPVFTSPKRAATRRLRFHGARPPRWPRATTWPCSANPTALPRTRCIGWHRGSLRRNLFR